MEIYPGRISLCVYLPVSCKTHPESREHGSDLRDPYALSFMPSKRRCADTKSIFADLDFREISLLGW